MPHAIECTTLCHHQFDLRFYKIPWRASFTSDTAEVNSLIIWWANTNAISRTFPDNVCSRYVCFYLFLYSTIGFDENLDTNTFCVSFCGSTIYVALSAIAQLLFKERHTHSHTHCPFSVAKYRRKWKKEAWNTL